MFTKLLSLLTFFLVFSTPSAAGADRLALFALQTKLNDMGFYTSDIDGLNGPSTRNAMNIFVSEYGGENSLWGIIGTIISDVAPLNRQEVSEAMQDAVKDRFNEILADGESARYEFDFSYPAATSVPVSEIAVCGRVNGKNLYGAYVGYTPFLVIMSPITWEPGEKYYVMSAPPMDEISELHCMMSTSGIAAFANR